MSDTEDSDIEIIDSEDEKKVKQLTDIQKAYVSAERGLVSVKELAKRLGKSEAEVLKEVRSLPVYQRTKPTKDKKENAFKITAGPDHYQIDIAFLPYKKANSGYVGFLLAVEITSRKAYAYPVKGKDTEAALAAIKQFVNETKPVGISSDNESSFNSHMVQDYFKEEGIEHKMYRPDDHHAMGILDRLARTIKEMFQKYFLGNNTVKWVEALPMIIKNYNNKPHKGIDWLTPMEMDADEARQDKYRQDRETYNKGQIKKTADFEEGDKVRILEPLKVLEKGRPRYSAEVYTIVKNVGLSYMLKDEEGKIQKHLRRPYELVEADYSEDDILANWRKKNRSGRRLNREFEVKKGDEEPEKKIIPREKREGALNATAINKILAEDKAT